MPDLSIAVLMREGLWERQQGSRKICQQGMEAVRHTGSEREVMGQEVFLTVYSDWLFKTSY